MGGLAPRDRRRVGHLGRVRREHPDRRGTAGPIEIVAYDEGGCGTDPRMPRDHPDRRGGCSSPADSYVAAPTPRCHTPLHVHAVDPRHAAAAHRADRPPTGPVRRSPPTGRSAPATWRSGVWECTPGAFDSSDRDLNEAMFMVSGRVTIHHADGGYDIAPGTLWTTPRNWEHDWVVHQTVRKLYVIDHRPGTPGRPTHLPNVYVRRPRPRHTPTDHHRRHARRVGAVALATRRARRRRLGVHPRRVPVRPATATARCSPCCRAAPPSTSTAARRSSSSPARRSSPRRAPPAAGSCTRPRARRTSRSPTDGAQREGLSRRGHGVQARYWRGEGRRWGS